MFAILLILFIIETGAFCYLFYKILEMEKDIETLYQNYSDQLEKVTNLNLKVRRNVLK